MGAILLWGGLCYRLAGVRPPMGASRAAWTGQAERRAIRVVAVATTKGTAMSFCEHCEGQRFDRAQVLRQLRQTRARLRDNALSWTADEALTIAIKSVRALEIPHLEPVEDLLDETIDDQVIH